MDLPTGTVTFLFTDIEGSSQLWEQQPTAMEGALARHDELVREAVASRKGRIFKALGDAFCCAFADAGGAIGAVLGWFIAAAFGVEDLQAGLVYFLVGAAAGAVLLGGLLKPLIGD